VGFGLAHAMQGRRGILAAMAIAVLFHGMVVLTQGLYLAVAFHSAYDLVVGIVASRMFGREAGTISTVPLSG
jgi:membrane protease YdiL (CAAX protease family)